VLRVFEACKGLQGSSRQSSSHPTSFRSSWTPFVCAGPHRPELEHVAPQRSCETRALPDQSETFSSVIPRDKMLGTTTLAGSAQLACCLLRPFGWFSAKVWSQHKNARFYMAPDLSSLCALYAGMGSRFLSYSQTCLFSLYISIGPGYSIPLEGLCCCLKKTSVSAGNPDTRRRRNVSRYRSDSNVHIPG
jgi:hypothetical protein